MYYLTLAFLSICFIGFGVINYRCTCRSAQKLIESYRNG